MIEPNNNRLGNLLILLNFPPMNNPLKLYDQSGDADKKPSTDRSQDAII